MMSADPAPPMQHALEMARRAVGTSSPNPPVGAVVVRDCEVVGEGWTQPPGQAHAEVVALEVDEHHVLGQLLAAGCERPSLARVLLGSSTTGAGSLDRSCGKSSFTLRQQQFRT